MGDIVPGVDLYAHFSFHDLYDARTCSQRQMIFPEAEGISTKEAIW
jgi:hypothetical protein